VEKTTDEVQNRVWIGGEMFLRCLAFGFDLWKARPVEAKKQKD